MSALNYFKSMSYNVEKYIITHQANNIFRKASTDETLRWVREDDPIVKVRVIRKTRKIGGEDVAWAGEVPSEEPSEAIRFICDEDDDVSLGQVDDYAIPAN